MPNPIIEINRLNWYKILGVLQDTFLFIANNLYSSKSKNELEQLLNEYHTTIDTNKAAILEGCTGEITRYVNSYQVSATDYLFDEFKAIYFLGVAITAQLERAGYVELKKIHQKTVLHLLNMRLISPYKALRPQLAQRINMAIDNNTVKEHLGIYGWYLLYKCLYNAAHDAHKLLNSDEKE